MLLVEIADRIGTITFDRDDKRNALCEGMVAEFATAFDAFAAEGVRCVVLRAKPGSKVWSAGHDIDELPAAGRDPLGWRDPLRKLVREIESFPAPVVAMVEGSVWGGACETVFACDLVVAAEDATFAATPARHGVPYNVTGLLTFLNAANLRLASEMLFTAEPVPAERLCRLGVINHVVSAGALADFTYAMARQIAANAPLAISVMKEQLRTLAGAHTMSPEDFERIQGLRRIVYDSHDYSEGLRAFKEKRKPAFRGD
ncbi:MAG: methylmalonyl-CoA decarboxylase [Rhodocyclales bacterium]|nr:methylmalonyl-CoA decarboxylase [Rhodocyclales bacterium]